MSLFINYTDQAVSKALDTFYCPEETQNNPYLAVAGLRFLFRFRKDYRKQYKTSPKKADLIQYAKTLFDRFMRLNEREYAREVADIVATYFPGERNYFLQTVDAMVETKVHSVYSDKQNVHNSKINRTVIDSATELCQNYHLEADDQILTQIEQVLTHKYPGQQQLINDSFHYMHTNTATFGKDNLTLSQIFVSLWLFIVLTLEYICSTVFINNFDNER